MKITFLVLFFFPVIAEENRDFDDFILTFKRSYVEGTVEYSRRLRIFEESVKRHELLNKGRINEWDALYGVNNFSDLTPEEFSDAFLMSTWKYLPLASVAPENSTNFAKHFDWRTEGFVTPIKNQKSCGSCWAFSIVETIESGYAKEHNTTPILLSSQQLISCDDTSDGCLGGVISKAMEWVADNNITVVPENEYPFSSGDGKKYPCDSHLVDKGVKVLSYKSASFLSSESQMVSTLMKYGPFSVAVDATTWQDYIGGIIQHHCPSSTLDHAVQVIGYNFEGPLPYWIVRNTWGTGWGLDGYVYIKYDGNLCGIAEQVVWVETTKGVNL